MEVKRLPRFLTGFDATCILWVVKHRLILSVSPGDRVVWLTLLFHVVGSLLRLQVYEYNWSFLVLYAHVPLLIFTCVSVFGCQMALNERST